MKLIYIIPLLLFIICIDQSKVLGNSTTYLPNSDNPSSISDNGFLTKSKKTSLGLLKKPKTKKNLKTIFFGVIYKKILKITHKNENDSKASTISFLFSLAAIILLIPALLNIFTGIVFLIFIPAFAVIALLLGLKSRRSGKNFKNTFAIITGGSILLLGIIISIIALATF